MITIEFFEVVESQTCVSNVRFPLINLNSVALDTVGNQMNIFLDFDGVVQIWYRFVLLCLR